MRGIIEKSLVAVVCLLVVPVCWAQENEPVTKWLAANAIPLKTVQSGESVEDLKPLKQVLRDVRILGLGEETHGTREFFQLKSRLVQFLVKDAGFNVFAMEISFAAASEINDYVVNGKGDRDKVLAKQGLWAWDTQEVAELLDWLRQYNSTAPAEKKVRFVGFDIHNNNLSADLVSSYLAKVAPERVEAFKKATQLFRADDDSGRQHLDYIANVSAADKVQTLATLNELLGFLYLNERRFTLKTSAAEFTQALQHTRILAEFADTYRRPRFDPGDRLNSSGYARDLYMAENVQWQIGELKPGTRMIIWAHNDHVGKFKGSLGDYLQQTYGPDYYALGFSFNQGAFQARELTPNVTIGALKEFTVSAAPEGSVEWTLNRAGIANFIVDLRHTTKPEAVEQWIATPRPMRSIGLGFSRFENVFSRVNLKQTYDGLVFIETSTRARPNPTGLRDAWIIPEKTKTN